MNPVQCPCSSVDRALASEARSGSSSLPRDAFLFKFVSSIVIFLILLSSCIPQPIVLPSPWQDWHLDDVLWLSNSPEPTSWIAAYFRSVKFSCQFRFDLLDYSVIDGMDLRLSISSRILSGNSIKQANYVINIPTSSSPSFQTSSIPASTHTGIQVYRNPGLDSIVLQLTNRSLCSDPTFSFLIEALSTDGTWRSWTPWISSDSPHPKPAYMLLTFWDTLPAATPLQLLRRWDGAHTGPYGQRHGLKYLLEAADKHSVPLFLLDLKQPSSLAGLSSLGKLLWIDHLQQNHIIFLPDSTGGFSLSQEVEINQNRQITTSFHLATSSIFYSPFGVSSPQHSAFFAFTQNPAQVIESDSALVFPLPYDPAQSSPDWMNASVTTDGLSETILFRLLQAAAAPQSNHILVLGGSLPTSALGDLTVAEPVMGYIAAHPWIQPLTQNNLMSFPVNYQMSQTTKALPSPSNVETQVFSKLLEAPSNNFSKSAWEMFLALDAFPTDEPAHDIHQIYLSQVNNLLYSSNWSTSPQEHTSCEFDLDSDGSPECILSNQNILLILDPWGGRLEFAAGCNSSGSCFQLIGSTAQFSAGLSDPTRWSLSHPFNPDPDVIPGALADPENTDLIYQILIEKDSISFYEPVNQISKTFKLLSHGALITVDSPKLQTYNIPFILDPAMRFEPGWPQNSFITQYSSNQIIWEGVSDKRLEIQISGADYNFSSYLQTITTLSQPENPDQAFPGIFFHPFPLTLISVMPSTNWSLQFSLP